MSTSNVFSLLNQNAIRDEKIVQRKAYAVLNSEADKVVKAIKLLGGYTSGMVDDIVTDAAFTELYFNIYRTVGVRFAIAVNRALKKEAQKSDFHFEREEYARRIRSFVSYELGNRVVGVADVTRMKIKRIVADRIANGDTIDDTADNLRREIRKINKTRSITIARTETGAARNFGALEGAKMTGLELEKEWLAFQDDVTRPDHANEDGMTVDINEPFVLSSGSRLMFPADPSMGADAADVINCRCTVVFKVKK